jgi:starvation-inducible DNA-binding protein
MPPTRFKLSGNFRVQPVELLHGHTDTAIGLHARVKQPHWNVRGARFMQVRYVESRRVPT